MRSFLKMLFLFCFSCFDSIGVLGDVGTATSYGPPYLPTKCKGDDPSQFPPSGYFMAAGDGIWDNGAACGRRYQMRCISGRRKPCKNGTIVVQVVDYCRSKLCKETMVLSKKAFAAISRYRLARINVEYAQGGALTFKGGPPCVEAANVAVEIGLAQILYMNDHANIYHARLCRI